MFRCRKQAEWEIKCPDWETAAGGLQRVAGANLLALLIAENQASQWFTLIELGHSVSASVCLHAN